MKIIAGLMSFWLSGCSFFAYGRPVVVTPPGGADPSTTVGATVRCSRRPWPIALDVAGAGVATVIGAAAMATTAVLSTLPDTDQNADTPAAVAWFVPAGFYISSAIYGGMRSRECRNALAASARAKLRGEPLFLRGAVYQSPASAPALPGPPGPPPPGPPRSVAPLPLPPPPH